MIHHLNVSIFDCPAQAIIHQANCQNTMGSGIAWFIRQKYPEAYEADCKTTAGDYNKLGTFSWTKTYDGKYVYNCYSQFRYGRDNRHTNYEAIYLGLCGIVGHAKYLGLKSVSLPHGMGCVQAGGSWRIVSAIIEDIFTENNDVDLYICKYTPPQ